MVPRHPLLSMFDKFLFAYLILSPICYSGGEDLFQYAIRFLMAGTMGLACLTFLFCKPQRNIFPKWPFLFILFCIYKLYLMPYHWLAMHGVLNISCALLLFLLVANYARDIRWLYRGIGIAVLLNMIYGLCHYFGYNPIFTYRGAPAGFFSTNSDLAGYMLLATPLMVRYLRGFGFVIPFLFSLIFLQNYTVIFCNVVSGCCLTLRRGFYPMLFIVIIVLSVIGIKKQTYSIPYKAKYRLEIWDQMAKGALRKPMMGYGLGKAINFTPAIGEGSFTVKNDYLEFGFEVGAFPAIVFVMGMFYILIKRYLEANRCWDLKVLSFSLAVFALSLICQSYLRNPKIAPTVMVILGWFYILTVKPKGVS